MDTKSIKTILENAGVMKAQRGDSQHQPLAGQTWAMMFSKSSTRTRVSFEVGIRELSGNVMFLNANDMQLGRGEPIKDTARVLGRMVHGAVIRTYVQDDVEESRWKVKVHSQFLSCDGCGRSLEQLTPHNFSFNSHLGWCSACEGLGTQTGANPAALIRDPKATLADGALDLWPDLQHPVAERMLQVLATTVGLPLDVPLEQIAARERRLLLHGTGDQWFTVNQLASKAKASKPKPMFRFQF